MLPTFTNVFARRRPRVTLPADLDEAPRNVHRKVLRMVDYRPGFEDALFDKLPRFGGTRDTIIDDQGRSNHRLGHALDECRHPALQTDPKSGRSGNNPTVFNDVLLLLPREVVRSNHINGGGESTNALCCRLAALHKDSFGRELWQANRSVTYSVAAHDGPMDMVVALFGRPVFLPGPDDRLSGELSITKRTTDGRLVPVKIPTVHRYVGDPGNLRLHEVPAGVYDNQRYLLLGSDPTTVPMALLHWFNNRKGYFLIDLEWGEAFADDPWVSVVEDPMVVGPEADPMAESRATSPPYGRRQWLCESLQPVESPSQNPERLIVTVDPVGEGREPAERPGGVGTARPAPRVKRDAPRAETPKPDVVQEPSAPAASVETAEEPATAEDGLRATVTTEEAHRPTRFNATVITTDYRPLPQIDRYALKIEGIALPKIGASQNAGVNQEWLLWLDRDGHVITRAHNGTADTSRLRLSASTGREGLFYSAPGERHWDLVTPNCTALPLANGGKVALTPVPRGASEHYFGILALPTPIILELAGDRDMILGRAEPEDANLAGAYGPRKVAPDLLTRPGSLTWPTQRDAELEQLNLSRRHLNMLIQDGCTLEVAMEKGKSPAWRVSPQLPDGEALMPGDTRTLLLMLGERLLVGCYLLTFERL